MMSICREEMGQSVPWSCKKVDTGCLKMLASVMSENVVIVIVVVVSFMVIQVSGYISWFFLTVEN